MASGYPVRISPDAKASLKRLLSKVITQNQLLVLSEIDGTQHSLSSFLRELSDFNKIPISTLKLSVKRLKGYGLIALIGSSGAGFDKIELTESGKVILDVLLGER